MNNTPRLSIYALLSSLLMNEADAAAIELIKNEQAMLELFENTAQWREFFELPTDELSQNYLNTDFVDIFILETAPYESFFTSDDQMVNSGTENPVYIFYQSYGFQAELAKGRVISPDHIAVELEFMHELVAEQQRAVDAEDGEYAKAVLGIQLDFLNKHLLPFALLYLPTMKNSAKTPFYYDLADITLSFLLQEHELIDSALKESNRLLS